MDLRDHAVAELAHLVASGAMSAVELTSVALDRIEAVNPVLNAWASIDADAALAQARALDTRITAGEDVGPLAGVPLGVKDLEPASGFVTGYGSALCADDPPSTVDSIQVARLRAAGCIVIGKTTTSEHGWKADTVSPHWGATVNPWNVERSAGGSSGGSAVALASGMVALATGSDAGGSIRIPASVCGLSGLKPTHGLVPIGGPTAPGAGVLGVRGPMARTAADIGLALDVVAGPHPHDGFSTGAAPAIGPIRAALPPRVVWAPSPGAPVDREIAAACAATLRALEGQGVEVVEADSLFRSEPLADWFPLWAAYRDRAQGHLRGTPSWDRIDPELRGLMDYARDHVDAGVVLGALDSAHRYNLDLAAQLERAPLILTPTVAGQTGPVGGQGTVDGEPSVLWSPFAPSVNLTRHPAGTACVGLTADGMPIGLHVIGPHGGDASVLRTLAAIEDLVATSRGGEMYRVAL